MTLRRPALLLVTVAATLLAATPTFASSSILGSGLLTVVTETKNAVGIVTTVVFAFFFIKLVMTREPGALAGAVTTAALALAAFKVDTIVGWLGITGALLA